MQTLERIYRKLSSKSEEEVEKALLLTARKLNGYLHKQSSLGEEWARGYLDMTSRFINCRDYRMKFIEVLKNAPRVE